MILGNNGFIWIYPPGNEEEGTGGFTQNLEVFYYIFVLLYKCLLFVQFIAVPEREVIARIRNCILALAQSKIMLYDTSIMYAYEESLKYEPKELLLPEAMFDVAILTQQRLVQAEN